MLADTSADEEAYNYETLISYTKAELLVIADEMGVEGLSLNNTKDEIINAILGAE